MYRIQNEKGQLILTLVLIMTVALAIGLSIVQKSLVDVSTSTKVEQSSRAFSAAEAGIEKALKLNDCGADGVNCRVDFTNINNSSAIINDSTRIPYIPAPNERQAPFEYPPIPKEEVAQVWLADLDSTTPSSPPDCGPNIQCYYKQNSLDVYWGDATSTEKSALEITLNYYDTTQSMYLPRKWYLDNSSANRSVPNFIPVTCGSIPSPMQGYQCKYTLSSLPSGLILLRARLLYNTTSQPLAFQAVGLRGGVGCDPSGCWLPPQARNIISTGASGETQRRIKLFQISKVVPPYFDYAIFSAGKIEK